jgi:hypothetical protein
MQRGSQVTNVSENGRSGGDPAEEAGGLSALELRFVDLVAGGASMDEAATALGKSTRTLRRWKSRPKIASAIRARTQESMSLARATLASAANRAARELDRLCSKAKPDAARVAACRAVLENSERLGELQELQDLVAELEARMDGGKGGTSS